MPELPEVETTFRAIEKFKGKVLVKLKSIIETLDGKLIKIIEIKTQKIKKYLIFVEEQNI